MMFSNLPLSRSGIVGKEGRRGGVSAAVLEINLM